MPPASGGDTEFFRVKAQRDAARAALQNATTMHRSLAALKEASLQAEAVGMPRYHLREWRKLINRETRKEDARQHLREAIRSGDAAALEDAIERGGAVCLEGGELLDARRALLSVRMAAAVFQVSNAPTTKSVKHLRALFRQSVELAVEDAMLSSARSALLEAECSVEEELCGVCLDDEVETSPMACCARDGGSARICSECLARALRSKPSCPFCRAPQL